MVNLHKPLITLVIAGFQATTHTASDEALLAAAQQNDLPGVISALEKGANINARSPGDVTAVMFAAHNGNFEMVKLLVERRADCRFKTHSSSGTLLKKRLLQVT